MELSDWSDVLIDNVDFFVSLIFVTQLFSAFHLDTECRLSQYQEDSEDVEFLCGLFSFGIFCLGTLNHVVSSSMDAWMHFWGWGMDRTNDKVVACLGSIASMVIWACLVFAVCCVMAGFFMLMYYFFGSDSMFVTGVIPFVLFLWEVFNQLVLLGIWKLASKSEPPGPECGMSAILKVPILGMGVNYFRDKKDKKAVKKWREDHLAKEWKCVFMDFPGCCISFLDMALFGAKKWGSWLVLFKGVIKIGTVALGFVRKVGKALSENQGGKHDESGKAQKVGADRC